MAPHSEFDGHETNGSNHVNGTNGSARFFFPNGRRGTPSRIPASDVSSVHDLVCVGFGPASLAIAVAISDALESGSLKQAPNVLFLEKQPRFAWHAGMLLPGARMQINFIKDLASLRNPRSHFTFLNYLHENDRLVEFTNLNTFLPSRSEYEDYLRWSASHFDDVVRYNSEVLSVSPVENKGGVKEFTIVERNAKTGATSTHRARNVVVAVGGQASIPKELPASNPRVVHSSEYAHLMPRILNDRNAFVRVAVIGGGQSAAEIFNNVTTLYPNSKAYLVMKQDFLKPSDDSPFVNSIFNPEFVDELYTKPTDYRANLIKDAKATNYGVVRLWLIEHLYERMYDQRRELGKDESKWPARVLAGRSVVSVEELPDKLRLRIRAESTGDEEIVDVDLLVAATGYQRNAHVDILKDTWKLLPELQDGVVMDESRTDQWPVQTKSGQRRVMEVGRDYKVKFTDGSISPGSGIWLQGCCEGSHGLSDTLLSVVGPRSGEMVESLFGKSA